MRKTPLLLSFLLFTTYLFAQDTNSVIVFGENNQLTSIGKQVYFLEDKEGKLTIEDIQKPEYQRLFKKSEQETPNFNATESKIWGKFTVENQTDEKIYLEIAQALAWYIDFYKPDSTGKPVLTTQTGMMRPFENREVDINFFLFQLPKKSQAQTYYFSIQSDFPLILPLTLAKKEALLEKSNTHHLYFGMFWGLIGIMFFYNLFVAYSVRDKLYFYYCLYLLATLVFINFASGNFGYRFNPISYVSQYFVFFVMLNTNTIIVFLIYILSLTKKSFLYKVLVFSIVLYVVFFGINLVTGRYVAFINVAQLYTLLLFMYILIYSLKRYLKGDQTTRFVVFSFSSYMLSVIILFLQNFDVIPSNFFTSNAIVFGSSLEVLLFSFALGDRINRMRQEKENAILANQNAQIELLRQSRENERLIKEQNEILAQKVAEKTLDLEEKSKAVQQTYEELAVTHEELQQNQEEILAQRDLLESKNNLLEEYAEKILRSMRAAKLIQYAMLPSKEKMRILFPEHFVLFMPKNVVSGDFWWANQVGRKKYLMVADCTGHGVPGAMLTMIGSSLLGKIVQELGITAPAEILENLHAEIKNALQQDQSKNNEGMDIAVVCWEETAENNLLTFAAAKRPLYYTLNKKIEKISGTRRNIGGTFNKYTPFETHTLTLPKNSLIYLGSDGYADQNDLTRQHFTERRLMSFFEEMQDIPLLEQKERLKIALQAHMIGTEQRDDILIVGVRL